VVNSSVLLDKLDIDQSLEPAAVVEERGEINPEQDSASANSLVKTEMVLTSNVVEELVREYFADIPVMVEVARCESTFRHINSATGQPLRGVVNSYDVGVMQINEIYHLERAEKLGLDIHTLEGNLDYARFLYQRKGTQPWSASRPCWGQSQRLAQR